MHRRLQLFSTWYSRNYLTMRLKTRPLFFFDSIISGHSLCLYLSPLCLEHRCFIWKDIYTSFGKRSRNKCIEIPKRFRFFSLVRRRYYQIYIIQIIHVFNMTWPSSVPHDDAQRSPPSRLRPEKLLTSTIRLFFQWRLTLLVSITVSNLNMYLSYYSITQCFSTFYDIVIPKMGKK